MSLYNNCVLHINYVTLTVNTCTCNFSFLYLQVQSENQSLKNEISDLQSSKERVLEQYQETQMKLKAITEYFEQKETQLHRKIGEEEMVRQRVETREAYAKERADLAEHEREKERSANNKNKITKIKMIIIAKIIEA